MDKFIVSARKYRPATFSTLIGQESIATTLKNSIKRGQLAHAYLFCGPRGVGKTTTARIFAKTINCMNPGENLEPCNECESCRSFDEGRSYCIHELDAASNNSVDDIRALTEKVMIPPQVGRYGVYIIDEVHMLSTAAFNAFLKTLEEPPAHAVFILATTEKQKIIPTILSRCQVFDFNRISIPDIVENLRGIAAKEEVTIDDEALHVIAQKADGAMRDALTLFDQVVAYCGNNVDYASVIKNLNVLDYEYYFRLTDYSLAGKFAESLVLFDEVLAKGFNALYFIGGFGNHLRDLLICKETASAKLLEVSPALEVKYRKQAAECPLKFLFKSLAFTEKCESDYARSNNQRLLVEFMLVKVSQIMQGSENADAKTAATNTSVTNTSATGTAATKTIVTNTAAANAAATITTATGTAAANAAATKTAATGTPELKPDTDDVKQETADGGTAPAQDGAAVPDTVAEKIVPAQNPENTPATASATISAAAPVDDTAADTAVNSAQNSTIDSAKNSTIDSIGAEKQNVRAGESEDNPAVSAQEKVQEQAAEQVKEQILQQTQELTPEQTPQQSQKQTTEQTTEQTPEQKTGASEDKSDEKSTAKPSATANRVSIKELMNQVQNEKNLAGGGKEEKKPLDFMGPSTNQPVTEAALDNAWMTMADYFETNYPKLVRFVATIRNTKPLLAVPQNTAEKITVSFPVGNIAQKQWIEHHAADKMTSFLRQTLKNHRATLEVVIKSKEEIARKLYLPQEKDAYLVQKNPEFWNLKKDLGAELQ